MVKKLVVIFLLIIMSLAPVLTGCVPMNPDATGGGNTGGGNNGGGDNGGGDETPVEIPLLKDYFSGVKVTYNPNMSGNLQESADNNNNSIGDKQDYVNDVKSQVNTMSKEIIIRLMAEYGKGVSSLGYQLIYEIGGEEYSELIFLGGKEPFDADPATFGNTYQYANKDAVRKSFYAYSTESYLPWNWTLVEDYNASHYIDTYIANHSQNLQLAIHMIKLGKNVQDIGSADYQEYLENVNSPVKELLINEFAKEASYIGMMEDELIKLENFILNVMIGQNLLAYENFLDVNSNGYFDAEQFYDSNGNDLYDLGEPFNDLNQNGIWDSGVESGAYDRMHVYFKNYVNTVKSVVNNIRENGERYPVIPGIQFKDYYMEDVESNLDDIFLVPMESYRSIILMNSQVINLESIWLAFESVRDFNLNIVARYHKTGEGIVFDDLLTSLRIYSGVYDIMGNDNDFLIEVDKILQTYGVTNSSLNPFVNNTESYENAVILNTQAPEVDYFTIEKENNATYAKYNDETTDYFEIVFYASPLAGDTNTAPISFRFGFIDISFN